MSPPSTISTALWIKMQEDAGLGTIGDGEQSRQHVVRGFLARIDSIDFEHKVETVSRNNRCKTMAPQVAGPLRLRGHAHEAEAQLRALAKGTALLA